MKLKKLKVLAFCAAARFTNVAMSECVNGVSDPYPSSGPQPTEFVITASGQSAPIIVPATSTAQGVMLKWDVSGITGSKTITAKARNAWGESAASGPFTFTAGTPAAPSGLGLSAQ